MIHTHTYLQSWLVSHGWHNRRRGQDHIQCTQRERVLGLSEHVWIIGQTLMITSRQFAQKRQGTPLDPMVDVEVRLWRSLAEGIDGATFRLVRQWTDNGSVTELDRLRILLVLPYGIYGQA